MQVPRFINNQYQVSKAEFTEYLVFDRYDIGKDVIQSIVKQIRQFKQLDITPYCILMSKWAYQGYVLADYERNGHQLAPSHIEEIPIIVSTDEYSWHLCRVLGNPQDEIIKEKELDGIRTKDDFCRKIYRS
jgi:hypothetical protein